MNTVINLDIRNRPELPEEFQGDDVRYTEELVELFLSEYTKEGDTIFDPFAGFGTTLAACERMKRIGYGVEFDEKRCQFVQSLLKDPSKIIHGDSTKLKDLDLPPIQFSITSPPYMGDIIKRIHSLHIRQLVKDTSTTWIHFNRFIFK